MNTSQLKDIKWAIDSISSKQEAYRLANNYFNGDHELSFASERFRNAYGYQLRTLKANFCPTIVNTFNARLKVSGFTAIGQGNAGQTLPEQRQDELERHVGEIWRRARMIERSGDVHKTALKLGDSYIMVWYNDVGKAQITFEHPEQVVVAYHPEIAGFITKAAKWFLEDDHVRLNLYYPDRIDKYVSLSAYTQGFLPTESAAFQPIEIDPVIPNPFGKVPIFHFGNNAELGRGGKSELFDIIPLQDALNKENIDMMVASEYNASPQRIISGLDPADLQTDAEGKTVSPFESSIDSTWLVSPGDGVTPTWGTFATSDTTQFTERIKTICTQIAIISGLPIHRLALVQGGFPSGESLKTSEAPLTEKVKDRQVSFGAVWADAMRMALQIEGENDVELDCNYIDTEVRNETAMLQNAVLKVEHLGVPKSEALSELGYTARQVLAFEKQAAEDEIAKQKAFDSGIGALMEG